VNATKLVEALSIVFKESPPQSSYDWHSDPIPQQPTPRTATDKAWWR